MIKSVFVGNLPFRLKAEEVREIFEPYGEVYSVKLIYDRETGRPRGFGFIEVDEGNVSKVIEGLNGSDCQGRPLIVNEARSDRKNEETKK